MIQEALIEEYSDRFADYLLQKLFERQESYDGYELLSLTPIEQVNCFLIKALYRKWQKETLSLRSQYFDYDHPQVQEALRTFMNVLSRHLRVRRASAGELLKNAVQDTLYVLLMPDRFFELELVIRPDTLSLPYLRNTQRYLRVNTHMLLDFMSRFEQLKVSELPKPQAAEILTKCSASLLQKEDPSAYLQSFDLILSLPEKLNHPPTLPENKDADLASPIEAEATSSAEIKTSLEDLSLPEQESQEHRPLAETTEEINTEASSPSKEEGEGADLMPEVREQESQEGTPLAETTEEISTEASSPSEEEGEGEDLMPEGGEQESQEGTPLAETTEAMGGENSSGWDEEVLPLAVGEDAETFGLEAETPAKEVQETNNKPDIPIFSADYERGSEADFSHITREQADEYTHQLFHGNRNVYLQALKEVSECKHFDDAVDLLLQRYGKPNEWELSRPEVKRLFQQVFIFFRGQ